MVMESGWQIDHTVPGEDYAQQWLVDSSFAAMGWSHVEPKRGATELLTLLQGQWSNGMVPHQIYNGNPSTKNKVIVDQYFWWKPWQDNPLAPKNVRTSGITAPPIIAEASWVVAQQLDEDDRQSFLKEVVPKLVKYAEWMYRERDFGGDGLITSIHTYESGRNYTPDWIQELRDNPAPGMQQIVRRLPVASLMRLTRSDKVNKDGEISLSVDAGILVVADTVALGNLGGKARYDYRRMQEDWPHQIEDVLFNSVVVRNNTVLEEMASEAGIELPEELLANMGRTREALPKLYVPAEKNSHTGQAGYFSRTTRDKRPLTAYTTIGSILPVYSGATPNAHSHFIAAMTKDEATFGRPFRLPTLAATSREYNPSMEGQGGIDPLINLLVIHGLAETGHKDEARELARNTLQLVEGSFAKAYSPETGEPLDKNKSSVTAAMAKEAITFANAQIIFFAAMKALLHRRYKADDVEEWREAS